MMNIFYMGGPVFMGILTLLLLVILALSIFFLLRIASGKDTQDSRFTHRLTYLKSIGLFTVITGFLGQLIGLIMAFSAIERVGDISPQIVVGGLKVSMIAPLYGILVYLLSLLIWFALDLYHQKGLRRA